MPELESLQLYRQAQAVQSQTETSRQKSKLLWVKKRPERISEALTDTWQKTAATFTTTIGLGFAQEIAGVQTALNPHLSPEAVGTVVDPALIGVGGALAGEALKPSRLIEALDVAVELAQLRRKDHITAADIVPIFSRYEDTLPTGEVRDFMRKDGALKIEDRDDRRFDAIDIIRRKIDEEANRAHQENTLLSSNVREEVTKLVMEAELLAKGRRGTKFYKTMELLKQVADCAAGVGLVYGINAAVETVTGGASPSARIAGALVDDIAIATAMVSGAVKRYIDRVMLSSELGGKGETVLRAPRDHRMRHERRGHQLEAHHTNHKTSFRH